MCVQYYSISMIEHAISCNIYLNQCQTAQIALLGLAGPAGAGLLVSLAWVAKGITIMIPTQYSNLQITKCRCWAQKVCAMAYCNIFCRDSAWFIVTQSWTLIWGAFASVCMNDRIHELYRIDVRPWFSFICQFIAAPTNCLEFFMVFTDL